MPAEPLQTSHVPLSSTEKVGWIAAICREALRADNLPQALDSAVRGLVETVGYFSSSIGLLDAERREVVNRAWCSRGSAKIPEGYRQTLEEGVVARVVRSGEIAEVPDVRQDPDYVALFPEVRSEICFPLRAGEEVIGVLDVNSDQIDDFDDEGRWLLETLSGLLGQIIEKSRLLDEVVETRDYLEGLIAAAGDAIATISLDGRVQRWNRAAEQMFGYRRAEMVGSPIAVLAHPEEAPDTEHLLRRVAQGDVIEEHEARYLHKDGRLVDVFLAISPVHDVTGGVMGSSIIIRDVSEARRMEARFIEMHRQVAASEEKYRSLVHHSLEAIFLVDPLAFTIQEANPCAVALTGRSAERLVGMRWPDLICSEDMEMGRRYLEEAAATGSGGIQEIRLRCPDQGELTLEITAGSVRSSEAPFLQIIGRDVTERRRAEGETEVMRSRLFQSEKLSAMGELISGVAHELNNPLTGVIGYAQLLLDTPDSENAQRNLERIQHEARRCHRIVQNLLAFARKRQCQWSSVSVNDLLVETLDLRAYQMRVDNIWVVRELDADLPRIQADSHQLQQVFVNLLNNAHQSMASTGRGGVLTVTSRRIQDRVMIRFADNGPGIPEDIRHRIFEPFFTTKKVNMGTGLGLSLCYGIIQDHGGTISVTSRGSVETVFVVELPAEASAVAAEGAERVLDASGAPPQEVEVHEKARRILVVDDEETILEFLSEALRMRGHEVDCAANGLHALDRIREQPYDAVITDLKMPGMSGRQFYQALSRELPAMARKVIFATGDLVAHDTIAFLESTGNTYLEKPFSIRSIAEALRQLEE